MNKPRKLKASEIEVRVGNVAKNGSGYSLLLYKNARVDMDILDETYGVDGWQREHREIKGHLFCCLSIWDQVNKRWVVKEDVGVPSEFESEKGEASDSFKRACFNVGIGRELYTAPFIWVNGAVDKYAKYRVTEIDYNEQGEINLLKIKDKNDQQFFSFSSIPGSVPAPPKTIGQNPFNAPTEKRDVDKVKAQIKLYGESPVLTADEKDLYRQQYKNCKTYDDFMSLCVDMELRLEKIK